MDYKNYERAPMRLAVELVPDGLDRIVQTTCNVLSACPAIRSPTTKRRSQIISQEALIASEVLYCDIVADLGKPDEAAAICKKLLAIDTLTFAMTEKVKARHERFSSLSMYFNRK
jgi:hypothetical protein